MPFTDLLRTTVFLAAAGATVLAIVAVAGIQRDQNTTTLVVAATWWLVAAWVGMVLGGAERAAESMRGPLAAARTIGPGAPGVSLPSPGRIAFGRLWPIPAAVLVAGGLGVIFPEVAAIGSGYALLVALAWRNREGAVLAVELRDGVRFLVETGSAFKPVKLIRSPGFSTF
jgi:hypothetical protein